MAGVARMYRPVQRDQGFLLPPDMREWLPEDHLVWLVLEIVAELDCSALHARHPNAGPGRAAYDPDMLLALLIYAYCQGVRSSRQIQQRCLTDVAFRVLCAQDVPDHSTIARFRADHQAAFAGLFTQVLQVAAAAGLARFGTVAIDGTKIPANASIDANRHRDWLAREVNALLRDATQIDAAEDAASALDDDGDRVVGNGCPRACAIAAGEPTGYARLWPRSPPASTPRSRPTSNGRPARRSGCNVPRQVSRWWVVSRAARTGWPRRRRIWPGRSHVSRPSWTIGLRRSPLGDARWVARRPRSSSIPTWCEPDEPSRPHSLSRSRRLFPSVGPPRPGNPTGREKQ
jgi:transposase